MPSLRLQPSPTYRMNATSPLQFGQVTIQTMTDAVGEVWSRAVDVCQVLGLVDIAVALASLDDDEKATLPAPDDLFQTEAIISEPGVYSLAYSSDTTEAKAFRRWLTKEVLPAIRKTGGYGEQSLPDQLRAHADCIEALETLVASEKAKLGGLDGQAPTSLSGKKEATPNLPLQMKQTSLE
jgi:prophage antirepressor-like protein